MANEAIATLISKALAEGIIHPGDETNPPKALNLPIFRTTGMPEEYVDQVNLVAKQLGEAIVSLIETDGRSVIAPRAEYEELRAVVDNAGDEGRNVPVHCRCDINRPLMTMRVGAGGRAIVNGEQLIRALSKRTPACPHSIVVP